jgi:hypothetical protein
MTVFVSHSSKDDAAIRELVDDLELARQPVWLDQELRGGDPWWQDILEQIRSCDVFLFALSKNSLASKPCRAELAYARALGLPILPVQIGPVDNIRIAPISDVQVVDHRERTTASALSLMAAVHDLSAQRRELPDPLPEPPPVPFEYLLRLGSAIEAAQLSPAEQAELIRQLRDCVETEDDEGVKDDALELLRALRRRPDVTYRNAAEIDTMLHDRTAEGPGRMSGEGAGRATGTPAESSAQPGRDADPSGSGPAFPQSDRPGSEGQPAQGGRSLDGDQPPQRPGGVGSGPPPGPTGPGWPGESGGGPGGGRQRPLLIAGMAALVLVVVLAATRPWGHGAAPSVATSTPGTPTSASTSTSQSSASASANSTARTYGTFLSTLPPDLTGCVESGLAGDGDVAAATCGPSSTQPGPQMAVFHRYPDRASLDAVFASDVRTAGLQPLQPPQDCSSSPGEFHWSSGGLEGGDVACVIGGGQIEIAWTDYAFLNEGVIAAPGTTQPQLTALYQWWSLNYRG